MASIKKFTHDAMSDQNRHITREHEKPGNRDIDPEKSHLNYSFPMEYDGKKPFQYYKQRIGEVYQFGRGTKREKKTITGCGWIVTLPKELYGDRNKEKIFFQGVYNFIADRYGRENIISNAVHYDEAGLPHIHIIFIPITKLDHNFVQFKTKQTKNGIQLASGRWEYKHIHVDRTGKPVDENDPSTWIKLNNYAKMSDYYDEKIDCNSVINAIELKHFHKDLQAYLTSRGIEGTVITGNTGTNYSVKELKTFTQNTGLHLDNVRNLQTEKSILESYIKCQQKITELEQVLREKDLTIDALQDEIIASYSSSELLHKEQELSISNDYATALEEKISSLEKNLNEKKVALENAKNRIRELEAEKITTTEHEWGHQKATWGEKSQSDWGKNITINEKENIHL